VSNDRSKTLAELVLSLPGIDPVDLAKKHVDDGTGRCVACRCNGARVSWPCTLRTIGVDGLSASERSLI
jgi:hypothetical protein